jgi:hypothetical protein
MNIAGTLHDSEFLLVATNDSFRVKPGVTGPKF